MKQIFKRLLFAVALVMGVVALFVVGFSTANGFDGSTARAVSGLTVAVVAILFLKASQMIN